MADLGPDVTAPRSVAVIGGGWAGCAAAATLAAGGVRVSLLEAAAELGGRGRRVELDLGGASHRLDNGQHLMIGAYAAIEALLAAVGGDLDAVVDRRPFELAYADGWRLRAARLPSPWHLAAALVGARGIAWLDRLAAIRFLRALRASGWRVEPDRAALPWLREHGQSAALIARLWGPLGIAALNTPLADASAQIYANVLRDSLGGAREASDVWLPRCDLSALLPDAIERFVVAHGGVVRRQARVNSVATIDGRFQLDSGDDRFDAVVYAAPPAQLAQVARGMADALGAALTLVERFEYEPIATVYLKYDPAIVLPRGFSALRDDPARRAWGQWVFDRGALDAANRGVLAVVVSASGPHSEEPLTALCDAVAAQLSRELGLPPPRAARAIVEKRATLAARPGLQRPGTRTAVPGFVLAGDWIDSDYPSTLESAVRSGVAAARALLR